MLIRTDRADSDGVRELLLVDENRLKKRSLKNLSLAPEERNLSHRKNKTLNDVGRYSLYALAAGTVSSLFVVTGGLAAPLLFATGGITGIGVAGTGLALRLDVRNGRFKRALKSTGRDLAIRIDPYTEKAHNSHAFNALMATKFGKEVLKPMVFGEQRVEGVKSLKTRLKEREEGAYHDILKPLFREYLAAMSFADSELERFREELPDVVLDAEAEINKAAKAWAKKMQEQYDYYMAEQEVMTQAQREQARVYFKGLVEPHMPLGDELPS